MYELQCPNCGWSAMLTDEQIGAALAEADRITGVPSCGALSALPVGDADLR